MLRVTFYSYKGGVGRTLALLNVAAVLAREGRKVVVVDLDLEAPGIGLSRATRSHDRNGLGASDFLFERRAAVGARPVRDYIYPIAADTCGGRLLVMSAGTRASELAGRVADFYRDPDGDSAKLFQLLVAEIGHDVQPDYLFFDSRTGLADIAGVCTVELPQVLVAFCGLSEQSVNGMLDVLERLARHPARATRPVLTLGVLSPLPRQRDLYQLLEDAKASEEGYAESAPVLQRAQQIQVQFDPFLRGAFRQLRHQYIFPRIKAEEDLLHFISYDPWVPLEGEILSSNRSEVVTSYRFLARSLTRAHSTDAALEIGSTRPLLVRTLR